MALSALVTDFGIEFHFTRGDSACQLGHVISSQRHCECQLVVNRAPNSLMVTNPPRLAGARPGHLESALSGHQGCG